MKPYGSVVRGAHALRVIPRSPQKAPQQWARHISGNYRKRRQAMGMGKAFVGVLAFFGAGGLVLYYQMPSLFPATESVPEAKEKKYEKAQIEFEKARKQASSKEEARDIISSQHQQVKQSWEHPGVFAWGANAGKVVDQTSDETSVKLPRRIPYFDGLILRDLKLTQDFGVAVTETGNLVQWGLGFSKSDPTPVETLRGKDITKIAVSEDRIIALSSNGSVYAVPARCDESQEGKPRDTKSSSWFPFWSSGAAALPPASVRNLTPNVLGWGESVVDVSSGLHHCLLLTSKGRVFSVAASTAEFPSRGQMGVPGLSWATRPKGAFDQPHEILSLKGFEAAKIATGDFHSVVLDKDGKIFTFGDNTYGQLGIPSEGEFRSIDVPSLVPTARLYANTGLVPKITAIAAGGQTTFFTVDATQPDHVVDTAKTAPSKRMPRVTADTWACGNGIYGTLGTGRWTHVTATPSKLKALSSLFEFSEKDNQIIPIRLSSISVGSTHASATMDNVTRTGASSRGSENDTNWGADVLFWGGNESYQLGTGKRANVNTPTYIGALDGAPMDDFHRLQLTPRKTVRLGDDGKGRKATLEQKVECGRFVTGVYSAA